MTQIQFNIGPENPVTLIGREGELAGHTKRDLLIAKRVLEVDLKKALRNKVERIE